MPLPLPLPPPSLLPSSPSQALDTHLKTERVRFKELFRQFDSDNSQHLDSRELREMIAALMPHATEAQLR